MSRQIALPFFSSKICFSFLLFGWDVSLTRMLLQGLSFAFPIPSQYTNLFTNGEGILLISKSIVNSPLCTCIFLASNFVPFVIIAVADLPLEFPDGTTPVTCRVSIYDSSTDSKVGVGSLMDKAIVPALPSGSLYMEEVHAKVCSC
jgi:hypothetical protein